MDVCRAQGKEDIRFFKATVHLLQYDNVVYEMLKIYFTEILKYKTTEQLEYIKQRLMAVSVHIATNTLTKAGLALAVATSVATGLTMNLRISTLVGNKTAKASGIISIYGVVQKAADSAQYLRIRYPDYYNELYESELEMLFFLIEPLFERSGAFNAQSASDENPAIIISRMVR